MKNRLVLMIMILSIAIIGVMAAETDQIVTTDVFINVTNVTNTTNTTTTTTLPEETTTTTTSTTTTLPPETTTTTTTTLPEETTTTTTTTSTTTTTTTTQPNTQDCTDSDGGDDPYIAGIVQRRNGVYNYRDKCISEGNALIEYSCMSNGYQTSKQYQCNCVSSANGGYCQPLNATLIPSRCNDSDGGNNPYVGGIVIRGISSYRDSCNPMSNILTEYHCGANGYQASQSYSCLCIANIFGGYCLSF